MFTNLQHHPELTQAAHRALPAISNTDLSRLEDEIFGRPQRNNISAFAFGSYFHSAILEPEQYDNTGWEVLSDEKSHVQWGQAGELAAAIKRRRYPRHVLYRGIAEQSYTATHEATGLTVKVRPDLLIDSPKKLRRTLVDFKTTSCATLEQFLGTVDKYGYDRQGALYADALGAHRVVLIAVQKKPAKGQEPQVWVHELTPEQMAAGRKKYSKLLRECAKQRASAGLSTSGIVQHLHQQLQRAA